MNSMTPETKREREGEKKEHRGPSSLTSAKPISLTSTKPISPPTSPICHSLIPAKHFCQTHLLRYLIHLRPIHPSKDRLHPSLITDPQTPKTHLSNRQPRPTPLILRSPTMHRRVQVELQSRSRPTQDQLSPPLKTDLSFPQSLNLSLFDL